MTTATEPARTDMDSPSPRGKSTVNLNLALAGRVLWASILASGAAVLIFGESVIRTWEASLAALWMNLLFPGGVTSFADRFFVHLAPDHVVAFRVTAECTSVILIAPLLLLGAGAILSRRIRVHRVLLSIALMLVIVTVTNQARLGLIAWMTQTWGLGLGYDLSHRILGTILGLLGFAAGLGVMVLVMGLRRRKRAPRHPKTNS